MPEPTTASTPAGLLSSRRRTRLAIAALTAAAAIIGVVLVFTLAGNDETTAGDSVVATLRVPGPPNWITAGEDALWMSLLAGRGQPLGTGAKLLRVNLVSGAAEQTVALDGVPLASIRVGDSLWVVVQPDVTDTKPGEVVELDWATGEVLGRMSFDRPVGSLAYGDGSLWVQVMRPSEVFRVDPATRSVIGEPIPISQDREIGLSFGEGAVWATAHEDGMLVRIDPSTGRVDKVAVGNLPAGVVVSDGLVWVANRGSGTVSRIDPETMRAAGDPVDVGATPTWITAFAGSVWVSNQVDGTVTRIDGTTGSTLGPPIRIAPTPANAGDDSRQAAADALSGAGGSLWVTSLTEETVSRIDPASPGGDGR